MFSCETEVLKKTDEKILAVLAHPDDETLISGTLSKLAAKGCQITIVYATSGDDGPDFSGRKLYGTDLAREREYEAKKSLDGLGIKNPPVFLKFPDSHLKEHQKEFEDTLLSIFKNTEPDAVISFGPDGITHDPDHIVTGYVTEYVFYASASGKLLLQMALSEYPGRLLLGRKPFQDITIDLKVDVSDYRKERVNSIKAHRTQFKKIYRLVYKRYVRRVPYEEFVIADNRDGDVVMKNCLKQ
ncbi:MAG: PIG-L deacetylase family protein [Bacteroidales bacterium]